MKKLFITTLLSTLSVGTAFAASDMANGRVSDIINTKHNFAAGIEPILPGSETRKVSAISEKQLCVFCHTPHGDRKNTPGDIGNSGPFATSKPFLWNRQDSVQTYSMYSSPSLNIPVNGQVPGLGSKMCLSCHDGTVAVGQVNVLNSNLNQTIAMQGAGQSSGKLVEGNDGYTSNLGADLSNDHPVGFVYNTALADADGELIDPNAGEGSHIGIRVGSGVATFNQAKQDAGVLANGDPSLAQPTTALTRVSVPLESNAASFDKVIKTDYVSINASGSVECTSCHDPHIRSTDFTENIKFLRLHRFQKSNPTGSFDKDNDINCLACHKKEGWAESVHADQASANHLYSASESAKREIPTDTQVWETSCNACHDPHSVNNARHLMRQSIDTGAQDHDIDKTCYECHGSASTNVLDIPSSTKDIEILGGHSAFDFNNNKDDHQITNGDFEESQASLQERHVTCTDCHNPHRAAKYSSHDLTGLSTQSTHDHTSTAAVPHSNKASGALRGASGVEPIYSSDVFSDPYSAISDITYTTLKGVAPATEVVEREYQVCLKCHSNYGISNADFSAKLARNLAMEFQPSLDPTRQANNHNSWHPVIEGAASTASGGAVVDSNNFVAPFDNGIGIQTMVCSDCHGSDSNSNIKGPHGSSLPGQLVAKWDVNTGSNTPTDLCFQCHKFEQYADPSTSTINMSNFSGGGFNNLHIVHAAKLDLDANTAGVQEYTCSLCHTKSAHGWKNKAMLVDKNTVDATLDALYYFSDAGKSKLAIDNYRAPGNWQKTDCASSGCHTP